MSYCRITGPVLNRLEENSRALGLVWPRMSLIAATLVILFYTLPANAAMLRCASHQLAPGEHDEIMAARATWCQVAEGVSDKVSLFEP